MLSIIIPSYKDPLLHKTIESLLTNCRGEIEIIPVIDGYELETPLTTDPRVKPIYQENTGQKIAVNNGMAKAQGEYVMRIDEHCMFAEGFDIELTNNCEDNWIVTPRRYFLDPVKWEVMDKEPVDYEKLIIDPKYPKFAGHKWSSRTKERADIMIDETMMMQGSCWMVKKKWWDEVIKGFDSEKYGSHYQDQMELVLKTWQAGGKLMVNKNTWFAHKHRDFKRTHKYHISKAYPGFNAMIKEWGDYYTNVVCPKWFNE